MHVTVHSSKLLMTLFAALMVWPSWTVRDCCCTRRAALAEASSSCCRTSAAEAVKQQAPCCAARAKATPKKQERCQVTSTCRCRFTVAAVAIPATVQNPRAVIVGGVEWAEPSNHAAELRTLASTISNPPPSASSGLDGPSEICIRLCRWLS